MANILQYAVQQALVAIRAIPPPRPMTWENLVSERNHGLTGVSVDEHSALDYSPVWSGVSTLARDIAKLPLMFYRNLPNGGKEVFKDHRLYRILHDEPNPEMTSFKFRETMQALCVLYGNAYAEIVRDDLGRPAGLYPIVPYRVAPFREERTGQLRYRVQNPNGNQTTLSPANVIHLSSLSTDGIIGHSIIEHGRASFGLGLATQKFGEAFFGNGSTFGGSVEFPPGVTLTEPVKDHLRTQIEAVHRGVERAHKILILAAGAKFTQRGTNPNDGQFNETRKFQINETARWLSMPPHKLGDLENAHFTNIEEQELQYYVGCVSGWLKMWEQELSRKLIARLEYGQQSIEHNLEGVLRGDSTKRADFYGKMIDKGIFTINMCLALENKNPIGPAGDVHMVPLNMIPLERYNEWIDAQLKAKEPQPQLPAPPPEDDEDDEDSAEEERTLKALEEMRASETAWREQWTATLQQIGTKVDEELAQAKAATESARQAELAAETRASAERTAREQSEAALNGEREALQLATEAAQRAEKAAAELAVEVQAAQQAVSTTAANAAIEAARAGASEQEKATALAEAANAKQLLTELEAKLGQALLDKDAASGEATRLDMTLRAEIEARSLAEASIRTQRQAELQRMTSMVAAHRELIVDALQRMARTETERARKRGGSPDQLRKWVEAFYDEDGRGKCAEILYPAVRAHLAWKGSGDDSRQFARSLADSYCDESAKHLRTLADGMDGDEFQAALTALLNRWEQDRPTALADTLLRDEIEHLAKGGGV